MDYNKCKQLRINPNINPLTGRELKYNEFVNLDAECSKIEKQKLKENEIMQKFVLYDNTDLFNYKPHWISIFSYLLYLSDKYNTCIYEKQTKDTYNIANKHLIISKINKKCDIIISMLIIWDNKLKISHANALIINNITKTIERFEPHGKNVALYDVKDLDDKLQKYAISNNMEYTNMSNKCLSLQGKEDRFSFMKGNCSIWSLWYIEYRLKHPNLTKEEIQNNFDILYEQDNLLLHKMIVYFGNNIIKTKIELYKYLMNEYSEYKNSYISVLIDMYKVYNINNRSFLINIIEKLENKSYNDIADTPRLIEKFLEYKKKNKIS